MFSSFPCCQTRPASLRCGAFPPPRPRSCCPSPSRGPGGLSCGVHFSVPTRPECRPRPLCGPPHGRFLPRGESESRPRPGHASASVPTRRANVPSACSLVRPAGPPGATLSPGRSPTPVCSDGSRFGRRAHPQRGPAPRSSSRPRGMPALRPSRAPERTPSELGPQGRPSVSLPGGCPRLQQRLWKAGPWRARTPRSRWRPSAGSGRRGAVSRPARGAGVRPGHGLHELPLPNGRLLLFHYF